MSRTRTGATTPTHHTYHASCELSRQGRLCVWRAVVGEAAIFTQKPQNPIPFTVLRYVQPYVLQ